MPGRGKEIHRVLQEREGFGLFQDHEVPTLDCCEFELPKEFGPCHNRSAVWEPPCSHTSQQRSALLTRFWCVFKGPSTCWQAAALTSRSSMKPPAGPPRPRPQFLSHGGVGQTVCICQTLDFLRGKYPEKVTVNNPVWSQKPVQHDQAKVQAVPASLVGEFSFSFGTEEVDYKYLFSSGRLFEKWDPPSKKRQKPGSHMWFDIIAMLESWRPGKLQTKPGPNNLEKRIPWLDIFGCRYSMQALAADELRSVECFALPMAAASRDERRQLLARWIQRQQHNWPGTVAMALFYCAEAPELLEVGKSG